MKNLVWLLVLINLGLLTYFNLDRILPSAPQAKQVEINPEKISLLTDKQIEALPKKAVEPTRAKLTSDVTLEASILAAPSKPTACFEWGIFSTTNLTTAQTAATKLALQGTVKEQTSQQAKRFWVYKPPLKSPEDALAKAAELKSLGVEDLFVVQEPKWKNAISFGVFEDEQLATKLLNELKAKGIKDVVKALRNQGKGHSSLVFKNLGATELAELKKLKPEFPEANLKEVSCN